jgi:hypothetical protein
VIAGMPDPVNGSTPAYCPRRTVLDKLLIDAGSATGAEVRTRHFGFGKSALRAPCDLSGRGGTYGWLTGWAPRPTRGDPSGDAVPFWRPGMAAWIPASCAFGTRLMMQDRAG